MRGCGPSNCSRPAGDRVKTDAKDAVHLARLLRLDEVTAVTVVRRRPGTWSGRSRLVLVVGRHGRLPLDRLRRPRRLVAARGADPRPNYEQRNHWGTAMLDARHAVPFLPNHRPAVPNPRISV